MVKLHVSVNRVVKLRRDVSVNRWSLLQQVVKLKPIAADKELGTKLWNTSLMTCLLTGGLCYNRWSS